VGSPKSPGAGFWPLVIVVVMAGLGISLILRPGPAAASAATEESRWGRLWIALGTMAFYVVALNPLGFPLATSVLLLVQLRWEALRRAPGSGSAALIAFVLSGFCSVLRRAACPPPRAGDPGRGVADTIDPCPRLAGADSESPGRAPGTFIGTVIGSCPA
jgi:hypothetical protein